MFVVASMRPLEIVLEEELIGHRWGFCGLTEEFCGTKLLLDLLVAPKDPCNGSLASEFKSSLPSTPIIFLLLDRVASLIPCVPLVEIFYDSG